MHTLGRRTKIAARETHSKYKMEYMYQLLELLGIERRRVLFLSQVGGGQLFGLVTQPVVHMICA